MSTEEELKLELQATAENIELLEKDPRALWAKAHELTVMGFDTLLKAMQGNLSGAMNYYMKHIRSVVHIQSRELCLLRELESRLRNQTMTEENLKDVLSLLDGLRAEVQAANEEAKKQPN